jgi:deferrochelatase/peroxidase EfeB
MLSQEDLQRDWQGWGKESDGLHDRLMEFSRAVTGATFFVPSLETLSSLKQ